MRRAWVSGILAGAALVPPVVWLFPALAAHQAPTFRDQADFFFPLKLYTADRLKAGEIPFWNPLSGLGEPWLANAQSGVLYPPTLFFLIPAPALAAALFLLLHFAIAAWGTWRFCKDEGVTDQGALLAAVIFAGSGVAASLSPYWNHFGAYAYLPAIAALARSGLRGPRSAAGLAVLIGLQAMAGSPELSAASLIVAFVLFLEPRRPPETGWREPGTGRRIGRFVFAAATGLALAGWVLVPFAELLIHSDRRAPIAAAERELGAVSAGGLASAVGLGTPSNFFLASLFVGPVALLAAIGAFAEPSRRRLAVRLGLLTAAGILLSASAPPGSWIRLLPGFDRVRYPAKALAPAVFGLAALAGLGLDSLRFHPERRRLRIVVLSAAACALAILAFARQEPLARAASAAGVAGVALLALRRESARGGAALAGLAALSAVASFALANRPLFRFAPEADVRARPASLAFLADVAGRTLTPPMADLARWVTRDAAFDAGMIERQREALIGYTNLLAGVRTVRTAAALPTGAARRIADAIDGGPDAERAAGAAGARVFWTPFPPASLGSRKVGEFYRAPLNPYRPRVSYVTEFAVEPDRARAWERAAAPDADWGRRVLLDREPSPRPSGQKGRYVVARLAEDRAERVSADVSAESAGILVLADLAYPGWTATLDGREAPLLIADGYLRAVAVPAGSHRVAFRYRPISFFAGAGLSLLAVGILLSRLRGRAGEIA